MYVPVLKSIRHKSSRMYHGVYSGRRRGRPRSENNERGESGGESERANEGTSERGSKQSLYLCSTLLLLRPFDPLFYIRRFPYRVSEGGLCEVFHLRRRGRLSSSAAAPPC